MRVVAQDSGSMLEPGRAVTLAQVAAANNEEQVNVRFKLASVSAVEPGQGEVVKEAVELTGMRVVAQDSGSMLEPGRAVTLAQVAAANNEEQVNVRFKRKIIKMFKKFFVFVVCIIAMMIGNSMQQIPGAGGFAGAPAAAMKAGMGAIGAGMAAAEGVMGAGMGAAKGAMGAGLDATGAGAGAAGGAAGGAGALGAMG
uniref:Uncharacterized protein n=1 Tax=Heliothis virescens TaxID=7102 RepID=A0A2A4JVH7_HELVI